MTDDSTSLSAFEQQVLDRLLEGPHPTLARLRLQVPDLKIADRETGDHGFVTRFEATAPWESREGEPSFQLLDVCGRIAGLAGDVGFILFVHEGRLERLEGQPLEGDWPAAPRLERLFFVRPRIEGGSEMVETPERDLSWALGQATGRPGGEAAEEEAMNESTNVFLEPDLTQKVPADILERKTEQEKESDPDPTEGPVEEDAETEDLSSRRLVYLVGFNFGLGTLLAVALVLLVPRATYLEDLGQATTGLATDAVRGHLTSTLVLVALAGTAGALLANLWGLIRYSGRGFSFPSRLEIPFYVRPVAGLLQGLLLFFAIHLGLSALTMGTLTLAWVTLPGRMAYVAFAFLTGFGVEEVTGKLREIAVTALSLRSKD